MGVWNGWGYGIAFFRALKFLKFGKNRSFCGISGIFLEISASEKKNRTLENGHSIRHQSIPPLSAGRKKVRQVQKRVDFNFYRGRGSGGVKSAGVFQSVRETGRDESQSVPSPEKLFKTRDLELPIFEGSVPSCSPHSVGYTRTSVHPYFP